MTRIGWLAPLGLLTVACAGLPWPGEPAPTDEAPPAATRPSEAPSPAPPPAPRPPAPRSPQEEPAAEAAPGPAPETAPEPSSAAPASSPDVRPRIDAMQEEALLQVARQRIGRADRLIASVGVRPLPPDASERLEVTRQLLSRAREAMERGDAMAASSLAEKAVILAEDLAAQ